MSHIWLMILAFLGKVDFTNRLEQFNDLSVDWALEFSLFLDQANILVHLILKNKLGVESHML